MERDEFIYLRGAVKHEQCQTASKYQTWVLRHRNGEVMSAGCLCVAV